MIRDLCTYYTLYCVCKITSGRNPGATAEADAIGEQQLKQAKLLVIILHQRVTAAVHFSPTHLDGMRIYKLCQAIDVLDALIPECNTVPPLEGANVVLDCIHHLGP